MSTIFISSKKKDSAFAAALRGALESKGHVVQPDKDPAAVGERMNLLRASDAFVPLLTAEALNTNLVVAEIGAARAFALTRPVLMLPVLVGAVDARKLIAGTDPVRIKDGAAARARDAAEELDRRLRAHAEGDGCPVIFVSHRHDDLGLPEALTNLLKATFDIRASDIRCTSVRSHRLRVGDDVDESLRAEVCRARVVLGVLTPDTRNSAYVLFELGASWGQHVRICPLLARGATREHIPAPLARLHSLDLASRTDCIQLIEDLTRKAGLRQKDGVRIQVDEAISALVRQAGAGAAG